ncbi:MULTISPECIES: hypothetical protein [Alteromonas]|jgi:hypothetical protein|uniref:hypothetical protein n=1 Tax=Alteromonas TaxID=226 RepID=UPI001272E9F4|nr:MULTISPECIES: hypothetical protein [Alteromonas]MBT0587925.1 hypothetical protein [Alteromonas oceanisediminis]CAI3970952.1 hypothetical protein EZ55_04309 [Alteromonas macleodii]VTP58314.1 hypothetical protein EZ55_04309 [Alteromonas macleodii]
MSRDQAIELCRIHALIAGEKDQHAYLPKTEEEANNWEPHEWVIGAIMEADFHGTMK